MQQEPFELRQRVQLPQKSAYFVVPQFAICAFDFDHPLGPRTIRPSAGLPVPESERMRLVLPVFTGERTRLPQLKYLRWRSFWAHSLAASLTRLNSGVRRVPEVGSEVLQRWPRRSCEGLVSMPSLGILRQSRRAWNSLTPVAQHFVNRLQQYKRHSWPYYYFAGDRDSK